MGRRRIIAVASRLFTTACLVALLLTMALSVAAQDIATASSSASNAPGPAPSTATTRILGSLIDGVTEDDIRRGGASLVFQISGAGHNFNTKLSDSFIRSELQRVLLSSSIIPAAASAATAFGGAAQTSLSLPPGLGLVASGNVTAWDSIVAQLLGPSATLAMAKLSLRVILAAAPAFSSPDAVHFASVTFPTRLLMKTSADTQGAPLATDVVFSILRGGRAKLSLGNGQPDNEAVAGSIFEFPFIAASGDAVPCPSGGIPGLPTVVLVRGTNCRQLPLDPAIGTTTTSSSVPNQRLRYDATTGIVTGTIDAGGDAYSVCYLSAAVVTFLSGGGGVGDGSPQRALTPSLHDWKKLNVATPLYLKAAGNFPVRGPIDAHVSSKSAVTDASSRSIQRSTASMSVRMGEPFVISILGHQLDDRDEVALLELRQPMVLADVPRPPSCAALPLDASEASVDTASVTLDGPSQAHLDFQVLTRSGPAVICYKTQGSDHWVQVGPPLQVESQIDYVGTMLVASDDVVLTRNYYSTHVIVTSGSGSLNLDSHSINTSSFIWVGNGTVTGYGTMNLRSGGVPVAKVKSLVAETNFGMSDADDKEATTPHYIGGGGRKTIPFVIRNHGKLTIDLDAIEFVGSGSIHNYGTLRIVVRRDAVDTASEGIPQRGVTTIDGEDAHRNSIINFGHGVVEFVLSQRPAIVLRGESSSGGSSASDDGDSPHPAVSVSNGGTIDVLTSFTNRHAIHVLEGVQLRVYGSLESVAGSNIALYSTSTMIARGGRFLDNVVTILSDAKFVVRDAAATFDGSVIQGVDSVAASSSSSQHRTSNTDADSAASRPLFLLQSCPVEFRTAVVRGRLSVAMSETTVTVHQNATFARDTTVVMAATSLYSTSPSLFVCDGSLIVDLTNFTIGPHVALHANVQATLFSNTPVGVPQVIPQRVPQSASFVLPENATLLLLDVSRPPSSIVEINASSVNAAIGATLAGTAAGPRPIPQVCSRFVVVPVFVEARGTVMLQGCAMLPYGANLRGVVKTLDSASVTEMYAAYAYCQFALEARDPDPSTVAGVSCTPLWKYRSAATVSNVKPKPNGLVTGGIVTVYPPATPSGDPHIRGLDYVEVMNGATFVGVANIHIAASSFLVNEAAVLEVAQGGRFRGSLLTANGILTIRNSNEGGCPNLFTAESEPGSEEHSVVINGEVRLTYPRVDCESKEQLVVQGPVSFGSNSGIRYDTPYLGVGNGSLDQPLRPGDTSSWAVMMSRRYEGQPKRIALMHRDGAVGQPVIRGDVFGVQLVPREVPLLTTLMKYVAAALVLTFALPLIGGIARIGRLSFGEELVAQPDFSITFPEFNSLWSNWLAFGLIIAEAVMLTVPAFHPHLQLVPGFEVVTRVAGVMTASSPGGSRLAFGVMIATVGIGFWALMWLPLLLDQLAQRGYKGFLIKPLHQRWSAAPLRLFLTFHTFASLAAGALFVPVVSMLLNPIVCATVFRKMPQCVPPNSNIASLAWPAALALLVYVPLTPYSSSSEITPFGHPPFLRQLDIRYKRTGLVLKYSLFFALLALMKIFAFKLTGIATAMFLGTALAILFVHGGPPTPYANVNAIVFGSLGVPLLTYLAVLIQVARFGPIPAFLATSPDPVFISMFSLGVVIVMGLTTYLSRISGRAASARLHLTNPRLASHLNSLLQRYNDVEELRQRVYMASSVDERERLGKMLSTEQADVLSGLQFFRQQKEPQILAFCLGRDLGARIRSERAGLVTAVSSEATADNEDDGSTPEAKPMVPTSPPDVAAKPASTAAVPVSPLYDDMLTVDQMRNFIEGPVLGRGTYGVVFMAMLPNGRPVAVKSVRLHRRQRAELLASVKREVDVLRTLRHQNIVRYYGCDANKNQILVFMEIASSGSLTQHVRKFGKITESLMKLYAKQILCGLTYLHARNVIHRDIKGENILIDSQGVAKLADFGCSKAIHDVAMMSKGACGSVVGSPFWMAPEVIRSERYGTKADIWSVGCTVIEMLNGGEAPWSEKFDNVYSAMFFIGNSTGLPTNIPSTVSDNCRSFLARCFERDVTKRASASELLGHSWLADAEGFSAAAASPGPTAVVDTSGGEVVPSPSSSSGGDGTTVGVSTTAAAAAGIPRGISQYDFGDPGASGGPSATTASTTSTDDGGSLPSPQGTSSTLFAGSSI